MSISLRLTLWFSFAFMVGCSIFGAVMYVQLSYSLAAGQDNTLQHRAQRAKTLLTTCNHGIVGNCASKFEDFAAGTPEGNLISIFNDQGKRLYPAVPDPRETFPWPTHAPSADREFSKMKHAGADYRVLSESVIVDSNTFWIAVAGQVKDNKAILRQFRNGLLWATPLFLALSALFGYFLSSRALQPVAKLIASFRSISAGNLSKRLPITHSGDELEALTVTCNAMLAGLDAAVGQIKRFNADASHELRSPISYIYTLSECALLNTSVDEESAASFAEIVRECREATLLLDNMLSLARCDSGQTELVFERTNLTDILHEVCLRAVPLAEQKQHRLCVDLDRNNATWIMGDPSSLRRLFWIMVDNAIKYTPPHGEIKIDLRVDTTEARVCVQDNGIGIPQDALPEIFGRFYRVDKARTHTEGTGLGLSIAKWISDIHRCDLSVESRECLGSTFRVAFSTVDAHPAR